MHRRLYGGKGQDVAWGRCTCAGFPSWGCVAFPTYEVFNLGQGVRWAQRGSAVRGLGGHGGGGASLPSDPCGALRLDEGGSPRELCLGSTATGVGQYLPGIFSPQSLLSTRTTTGGIMDPAPLLYAPTPGGGGTPPPAN